MPVGPGSQPATGEDTRATTAEQRTNRRISRYPVHVLNIPLILAALCLLPSAQDPTSDPAVAETPPKAPVRAPLVAEGTIITDIKGVMVKDGRSPLWRFRVEQETGDASGITREFILLPSHLLQEMEMKAESIAPKEAHFSLSGEVLNYGQDNWLLPQHVEWITTHAERNEPDRVPADPSSPDAVAEVSTPEPDVNEDAADEDSWGDEAPDQRNQGDSIADIVAGLQSSVGPLRRSVDTGEAPAPVSGPREGQLLVSRRGRLGRGPTGAWLFVLDSDVTGLSDPSLVLLPSQKTAELEVYGGYGWLGQPMLVSGEVFTYRGRHFLRPTAWKMVRERPNLIR